MVMSGEGRTVSFSASAPARMAIRRLKPARPIWSELLRPGGLVDAVLHDLDEGGLLAVDTDDEDLVGQALVLDDLLGTEAHGVVLAEDGVQVRVLRQQGLGRGEAAVRAPAGEVRVGDDLDVGRPRPG